MSLLPATPQQTLLSLINAANPSLPLPVTADNLYFGNPRLLSDGITSVVPATGVLATPYKGYVDFQYRRTNLSTAYDTKPILQTVGASTLYGMLDVVNQFLGLNLTQNDVVDTNVATVGAGEQVNINVATLPSSLAYTGSFTITFIRLRPQMSAVIKTVELPVLTHLVNPANNKKDLDMLMWNIDFSNSVSALKVTNNYWTSVAAVQALMAEEFGFTDWPAPQVGGVTDYATSAYPGANTKYQRVAVQKNATGVGYQGNALFHYNLT
jgi:hypothetical protein